jgi:hypothetical protein
MLEFLEKGFPDKCPTTSMTDREIWVYAGKVQLIRIIRAKYEEATEKFKPEVLT